MSRHAFRLLAAVVLGGSTAALSAADWTQFRGKGGLGISSETGLPTQWSSEENIAWKAEMPGPGASCPITLGDRVFITCYSGYGLESNEGDQKDLVRHLLCLNRKSGETVWHKKFEPTLPEHNYRGEGSYHGYAASTPTTDGERLYVFFGKSGVFCFGLDGEQLWQASVGERTSGWGSGGSPLLHGNLVIINASVESGSLVAFDKLHTSLAVRTGGRGDVTESHGVWRLNKGANVSSPIYYKGHLYWTRDGSTVCCQNPATGEIVSEERLQPGAGRIWSSPVLADGKLYYVSQHNGTYVVAANPTLELLAHNVFDDDDSRTNASPTVSHGQLFVRTDRNLYCIGTE